MADVNTRPHRATRQPPVTLLEQEHEHLHRLPRLPLTLCFGQTRKVDRQATVAVGDAIYSVPHELIGERVWVRADGEQLVTMHINQQHGPREVARHRLTTPGRPSIQHGHYPPRPAGALERKPRARNSEEREFLAIRDGAKRWLERAAAEGTARIRRKMAEAIDLAKLHGIGPVNEALERCASYGRFADGDLASILAHQQSATVIALPTRAPEDSSLQRSTRSLGGIRTMNAPNPTLAVETDTLSGDLRPCETLPRPIPYPPSTRSGGSGAGDDRQAARPTTVPDELDRLLRRLPMPYVRRAAPEVVATAVAQRWEHAEVLRILPPRRPPAATKRPSRCAAARLGYRPARRSTHGSLEQSDGRAEMRPNLRWRYDGIVFLAAGAARELRVPSDPEDCGVPRLPLGPPPVERLEAPPPPRPVRPHKRVAIVDLRSEVRDRLPTEVERDVHPNIQIDPADK